jgi:tight adherence protein B
VTGVAVVLAGLAAALLLPPTRRAAPGTASLRTGATGSGGRPGVAAVVLLAGAVGALVVTVEGLHLVLALIGLGCAAAVGVLVRRARRAAAVERRQALVVAVCEALVGERRAGQPLTTSLAHSVEVWPDLAPVVAADRLGADVPTAVRRLAAQPGAEGLREVAAAWQLSQQSGAGLATALAQVAETARQRQSTRHLVQGELASAQATARLVALLPVASLAMSAGIGGDPWHFLFGTPAGLACLGAGAAFAFAGLLWIDRIAVAVLTRA